MSVQCATVFQGQWQDINLSIAITAICTHARSSSPKTLHSCSNTVAAEINPTFVTHNVHVIYTREIKTLEPTVNEISFSPLRGGGYRTATPFSSPRALHAANTQQSTLHGRGLNQYCRRDQISGDGSVREHGAAYAMSETEQGAGSAGGALRSQIPPFKFTSFLMSLTL